ncbi:Tam3-transposase (Ac family) protein [Dioscorea alata]|uniref:Tam3-transposase (Ac family) protein n=1 Tax=Dioscorea alata TaxID=55571 RepID=A0ACB7UYB8_DIOAL|nr:Tam3-transposase (Ac family) protein [Dioscorea alata]
MDEASYNLPKNVSPIESCGQSIAQVNSEQYRACLESTTPNTSNQTISTNDNEEVNLAIKRKLTSVVWNHFKKEKIDDKWKAICNYYQKKLGGESKNGTKHLHDHFASCPLRKTRDIKQRKVSLGTFSFDEEVARKELASMIVLHEYPLSMVEHFGFRKFVGAIQPLFKNISRGTVKRDILKIYEHEKTKTMKLLEENNSRFAITTDMWTSSNQKKGFMAITAHYIDASWSLQSRIIRFIYVPCPHTADVLYDVLINCLMDWNIDKKLSALSLDNCSTNDSLVNLILSKLSCNSLWMDGTFLHMRYGLEVIFEAIEKVRESVAFWSAAPKRNEKFEETAHCKTRWNSTYFMLNVAICYKDVFKHLKQREPLYKCVPLDEEWEMAKEICDKLKMFHAITESFFGTKYPTANIYFSKICDIKLALKQWINCGKPHIQAMASKMMENFDKYWTQIHGIMGLKLLEYYCPLIYGYEVAKMEIDRIQKICYHLISEYSAKFNIGGYGGCSQSSKDNPTQSALSEESESMTNFDLFVSSIETEKETRLIPRKGDFDILSWWRTALKYPTLQLIARDILAIPVSTVASELAFSTSGRIVSPHHSSLHPDTLEALMCAQNWLWTHMKGM